MLGMLLFCPSPYNPSIYKTYMNRQRPTYAMYIFSIHLFFSASRFFASILAFFSAL